MRGAFLLLLLSARAALAQELAVEAKFREGRPLSGELRLDSSSGWQFRSGMKWLSPEGIDAFRLPRGEFVPLRVPIPMQIRLTDRQVLWGEIVKVDDGHLILRTAWAEAITVPRSAIERIEHPRGWQPILVDSFERESALWKRIGKVERREGEATSGQSSLVLDAPGQSAALELPERLAAGKVGINVRLPNATKGRRWFIELEFTRAQEEPARVRLEIAGPGAMFEVLSPVQPEYLGKVQRIPGWQRLSIEFAPASLRIFVDDLVLWSQAAGAGGNLRACRLSCEATELTEVGQGEVCFDDFAIYAAVEEQRNPLAIVDATQDAVISREGDVLYGQVKRLGSAGITLEGRFGQRSFPWTEAQALAFRRGTVAMTSTVGEHVQLRIRTNDGLRDLLEGSVNALNRKELHLRHELLGDLSIPIARIEEIRPRFLGQRLAIEAAPHHLGKRLRSGFLVPQPEGLTMLKRFKLDRAADGAILVVEVCHLVGSADGKDVANSLRRGGMQTTVFVNDKRAGCLNDGVDRSSREPKILRLPIPNGLLAAGENVLEFRQTVDPDTGQAADCEIRSIRIELPRKR